MATTSQVRQWGIARGLPLPRHGRLPRPLLEAWNAANPDDQVKIPRSHALPPLGSRADLGNIASAASRRVKES